MRALGFLLGMYAIDAARRSGRSRPPTMAELEPLDEATLAAWAAWSRRHGEQHVPPAGHAVARRAARPPARPDRGPVSAT